MRVRVAAPEHLDDVPDRRAIERGDDSDLPRQRREPAFARRVEEPLGLEFLLQLRERELKRAKAMRLEVLADDLVFALRVVDADAAAGDDAQTVLRLEFQVADRRAEHHGLDLRATVLQREVQMASVPQPAVRDFPLDPDV